MKKFLSIILAILILAIAAIAVYRFGFRKSIPDAPVTEQVVSILDQNGCFECHSQDPVLPFYAEFPVIGKMIKAHALHAVRFTDLKSNVCDNTDEVTLSMLDYTVRFGQMPPFSYKAAHWGTGFNSKEKSVLTEWINESRGGDQAVCPIPESVEHNPAIAALGEKMFNDARLSFDGSITCAECHILENGGADMEDERVSEGIYGLKGGVNAPTVYNAVFNIRQFWNGRAADLQEQAAGPATNPVEMGDQTLEQIVERLSSDKELVAEFAALYPGEGLTPNSLTHCIAEFEKTLVTPGSRFDKYLLGDETAMNSQEIKGYNAFMKNACITCHTGVALGGKSFDCFSIFGDYFADRCSEIEYNSDDDGLKGFTGRDEDLHKFKTPGLRNVALTAPYFHDGTQTTLEDAVKSMAKYELGKSLSQKEVDSIVAFMQTLTGENPYM